MVVDEWVGESDECNCRGRARKVESRLIHERKGYVQPCKEDVEGPDAQLHGRHGQREGQGVQDLIDLQGRGWMAVVCEIMPNGEEGGEVTHARKQASTHAKFSITRTCLLTML